MKSFSLIRGALALSCAVVFVVVLAAPLGAQTPPAPSVSGPSPSAAADAAVREEVTRLREEFERIRESYGARLAALEARIGTTPAAAPMPETRPGPGVSIALPDAGPADAGTSPAAIAESTNPIPAGGASSLSKIFNPDMAVVGNFVGAAGRNTVEPSPALEMREAEVSLQAIVDPYARADFFLAASPEGLEIEEGFLTLTSLPGGLLAKVGKLKQQFGKVNTLHAHALPWVDAPLVVKNLLGGEEGLNDSGISVSRLVPNPLLFLEATGELYQGTAGPFQAHERSDVSWLGRLRGYRDLTEGINLDIGASFARGHNDAGLSTRTRLLGIDATVRYRPLRRSVSRRFLGRTELIWSRRGESGRDVSAFGMYASGEYQFARRWFSGLRYDRSQRAADSSLTDSGPSLLVTYRPSEFSQMRAQYRRTRYAEQVTSNELLFQFLFSIGAHGAHTF